MKAFHGDQKVKDFYIARVKSHYAADEIVHGKYWENGRGCAIGCVVHSSNHAAFETELGISQTIAHLEDHIFEGMKNGDSKAFPLQFLEAIQVGADLSMVWPQFAIWLLTDEKHGVRQFARPDGQAAIDTVADLYRRQLNGETIERSAWRAAAAAAADAAAAAAAAWRAAWRDADAAAAAAAAAWRAATAAAAADAADAAAAAAAWRAATAAADAADAAADAAAAAAADAAAADDADAWRAARKVFWVAARDELLRLLASAPVPELVN